MVATADTEAAGRTPSGPGAAGTPGRRIPIAALLVFGMAALVLGAVASVLLIGLLSTRETTRELLRGQAVATMESLVGQIDTLLRPIEVQAEWIARKITTGEVVAGGVGAEGRLSYTVHGDAVNLAARLEQLNKEFGTRLLIADTTARLSGDSALRRIGEVAVRGKSAAVTVFTDGEARPAAS